MLSEGMLRRGITACLFIATDFIDSTRVPWWDEKSGICSEWMSWNHVRSLRDDGFRLGAHTKNHVDLGVISGDEADEEIISSGHRLSAEANTPIDLFSYPYGRQHQITEKNRQSVRNAEFVCCPSAYGGTVGSGEDPFHIRRTPISPWHISPYQFGFEAMLSR